MQDSKLGETGAGNQVTRKEFCDLMNLDWEYHQQNNLLGV